MIDYATLTGAARVALGPELPALFSNDDALAEDLLEGGSEVTDPLWRLPLWSNYAEMLKSEIADVNNAGEGGMAGAVTAALFLQKFVPDGLAWAHPIGRESCRERVCQYVSISVVADSLKKKKQHIKTL